MKKTTSLVVGIAFILAMAIPLTAKAEEKVASLWAQPAPAIDGVLSEWLGFPRQNENEVDVEYAFRNDEQNLYILFVFKNPAFMSSLNYTGLTVWVNPEGKKKANAGMRCQKKRIATAALIALLEKQGTPLTEEKKKEIQARASYLVEQNTIISNKKERLLPLDPGGGSGAAFKSQVSGQSLVFEVRIPFTELFGASGLPAIKADEPLWIGFAWGGMTTEMRQAMMRGEPILEAGGDEYDGGGVNDSTDVEQRGDVDAGPNWRAPKKYAFWVPVQLAAKQ